MEPIGDAGYTEHDIARLVPETHHSERTAFARDRARLIHASSWRRLAAKTQVLSPTAGIDFARNRLTHSLEVAQIGRELAHTLGLSKDVVDTACLAHDLGHPPFGHNGERALDSWITDYGGFEGNAQTLRILIRLEGKVFDRDGTSRGLNLTRATLDASCKYPWPRIAEGDPNAVSRRKFGYYLDDAPVFAWIRDGAPGAVKCAEAQAMDLADDIAYSVHDFEDAIVSEYIDPEILTSQTGHEALIRAVAEWAGGQIAESDLAAAFDRLAAQPRWLTTWTGSREDHARLKNFTSDMIGRFAGAAIEATRAAHHRDPRSTVTADGATAAVDPGSSGPRNATRYGLQITVPEPIRHEIAVLKGIVAAFVMASGRRQPTYQRQRDLLAQLLDTVWADPHHLDPVFARDFAAAEDEAAARRVVVDQIASLTDQGAISWYERLCQVPLV